MADDVDADRRRFLSAGVSIAAARRAARRCDRRETAIQAGALRSRSAR